MRDPIILLVHLIATLARLMGPGGLRQRTAGIEKDAPGRGRPATVQHGAVEAEVIRKTTRERPPTATHWSTRTLAAELCISPASVRRIWKRHGLKPHLVRLSWLNRSWSSSNCSF